MLSLQAFDFRKVPLGLSLNDSARPLKATKTGGKIGQLDIADAVQTVSQMHFEADR